MVTKRFVEAIGLCAYIRCRGGTPCRRRQNTLPFNLNRQSATVEGLGHQEDGILSPCKANQRSMRAPPSVGKTSADIVEVTIRSTRK
jgi:hypothetical protein